MLCRSLGKQAYYHSQKKSSSPFDAQAVHIDTDLSPRREGDDQADSAVEALLARYREASPNVTFECVHLTRVLEVRSIDWATLPVGKDGDPAERLRALFENLPSVSSRADILRLLIRHLLLHLAIERDRSALLLGHSTTALAALTLSEVASGRGFAVPWHVNDGSYPVPVYDPLTPGLELARSEYPLWYPMRELLSNEIATYVGIQPEVQDLIPTSSTPSGANVVSHKDLSIEEVMTRYFEGVEGPYAGIVANVVRTTGKLDRYSNPSAPSCGLCGLTLDEQGDSTWAGELGEKTEESTVAGRLCYGCKRSIRG